MRAFYYDDASRVTNRLPRVFSPLTQRHTTHQTPAKYHANTPPSPPRHSYYSGILDYWGHYNTYCGPSNLLPSDNYASYSSVG